MSNNEKIPTPEDRELFIAIAKDIKTDPAKYLEAGKWLDEYCSADAYWQREENNLKELQDENKRIPTLPIVRRIKQLEEEIEIRRTPALIIRFQESRNYLFEKYKDQQFIPEDDARRIVIITWLLTDPDTEKFNLEITKLENWAWEPIDDVSKLSRGYAQFLWCQDPYKSWMKLVRIVSDKLGEDSDKPVLLPNENNKRTLAHSFLYNLLRASIKHLPFVGSFLYDVIYGTLDSRASQKQRSQQPRTRRTSSTFKKRKALPKDKGDSDKSSQRIQLSVSKITLLAAIITLVGAILTSPLWRPLITKIWNDSPESKKISPGKIDLSLKEICQDIDSRPLVQQEETGKRYIGVRIEREYLKLFHITEDVDDGIFLLTLTLPRQVDVSYLTGRKIYCSVSRELYPQLNSAKRGADLYVSGQIEDVADTYIQLSDVSLNFD